MNSRDTPHPFPSGLGAQLNHDLREAKILDSNACFIVRRAVANAYAAGFNDGSGDALLNECADRQAREDAEAAS